MKSSLASWPPVSLPKKTKVFLQELPRDLHTALPPHGTKEAAPVLSRRSASLPRARSPHHPSPPQGGSSEHPALAVLFCFPLGLPAALPASPGWAGLGPEEKARPSREGPRAEELRL